MDFDTRKGTGMDPLWTPRGDLFTQKIMHTYMRSDNRWAVLISPGKTKTEKWNNVTKYSGVCVLPVPRLQSLGLESVLII